MSEFVFSDDGLESICCQGSISAARLLEHLEFSDDMAAEETLDTLCYKKITLDISDIPSFSLSGSSALRLCSGRSAVCIWLLHTDLGTECNKHTYTACVDSACKTVRTFCGNLFCCKLCG